MNFELWQLFLAGVGYLGVLFLIATAVERRWLPLALARHPLTYTLSLGVYATSWSFYGSVGFAEQQGFNFLTIYLGVTLAFIATPVLLRPILRLTQEYQLSSLADLLSFRYHSQAAGVLVTLFMVIGTLPYIALQIQAVSQSLALLTGEATTELIAIGFCITIALFTILFGTSHITPREKHEGLVVAIAFESLVKLIALLAVGLFAYFGLFSGSEGLNQWLDANPEALQVLYQPVMDGEWGMLLLLSFAAAFLLPRQFHMVFVENSNQQALNSASWAFPFYLLLLNLSIPVILWAAGFINLQMPTDFFVLGVAMQSEGSWLPLLTFIGGLSAASAMIIVTTIALAAMILNHLLLPAHFPNRNRVNHNIYHWIIWGRRSIILLVIGAGFGFYLLLQNNQQLAGLGLISFVAVAQFLPGIVGLLYWKRATRSGFIFGLLMGIIIWFSTQMAPLLYQAGIFEWQLLIHPLRSGEAAFWSLFFNALVFVVISLSGRPTREELEAASACCRSKLELHQSLPILANISQFEDELSEVLGEEMAHHEIERALTDLDITKENLNPITLGKLHKQIIVNLSGLIGPMLARYIMDQRISLDDRGTTALADSIRFMEHQLENSRSELKGVAGELDELRRFHRQVLQDLPLGVVTVSRDMQVVSWNSHLSLLSTQGADQVVGRDLIQIPQPWAGLLQTFLASGETKIRRMRLNLNGEYKFLNLHKATIEATNLRGENLGTVILVEDMTDLEMLEQELTHSERLASIGRLATGVAHEIGNPVTAIACLAQEMQAEPDNREFNQQGVAQILSQTERISNIVHSLVSFSHAGTPSDHPPAPVQVKEMIDEAIDLVSLSRKGKRITFANSADASIQVMGHSQQLSQVMVNLLTNACDASNDEGRVEISTRLEGRFATISVTDYGEGMPSELQEKIFEPFFTTKEPGSGTGLGLSLSFNIIQRHGGNLNVSSEPGKGSRFTVRLPTAR